MNMPSDEELNALWDKGGFDAVQADAEAAAHRDSNQILADALGKCEFPKPTGKGICGKPATQIVNISGFKWSYNAKACDKCADQLEKEVRVNATKDR